MIKRENRKVIARGIIRNGSWLVPDASNITLADIEIIESMVMFPLTITRCELTGWGLECKDIQQERMNSFWWGQEAGPAAIENPIEWIARKSKP